MPVLEGVVERITYRNEDNGYTVIKVDCPGKNELTAVVGKFPVISEGECLRIDGKWTTHEQYGQQFEAQKVESITPVTLRGLKKYLGSGMITGIGEAMAERIVDKFGMDTLDIIKEKPQLLKEVSGIGSKKLESIKSSFGEHKEAREIMIFLQGHGISPTYASRIYNEYREQSLEKLNENPYCLTEDIFGIGFKKADQIARSMGIGQESLLRVKAGIKYLLETAADDGHVYLTHDELLKEAEEILNLSADLIKKGINELRDEEEIFIEKKRIYIAPFYYAEKGIASMIYHLYDYTLDQFDINTDTCIKHFEKEKRISLAKEQKKAIETALEEGILVITGGPGTGKTTIVNCILRLLRQDAGNPLRIKLAAPTGRAAKRLSETTGMEASTIHRLLGFGYTPGEGMSFDYNSENPLLLDVLVVDEVSMIDIMLMYKLLKALKPGTRLILVGDVDQLPPVGAGNVLSDIIKSGKIPVVRLKHIFRQAKESKIIINAHRINKGQFPAIDNNGKESDFFFLEREDPEIIVSTVIQLCSERLKNYLDCDPIYDIQVISPMRRTATGIENLNSKLHDVLNPRTRASFVLNYGDTEFRTGDKVMQIKNNYTKEVFNGDMGQIGHIDNANKKIFIDFPDAKGNRRLIYSRSELNEIVLAYAISVHKSQGSEYPVVVMPVTTQHFIMLQRNLIYTAITRAERMVVLVGTKKALGIAVNNNKIEKRNSILDKRIRDLWNERSFKYN